MLRVALPRWLLVQGGVRMSRTMRIIAVAFLLAACIGVPAFAADASGLVIGAIYVGNVSDYGYNRSFHDALTQVAKTLPGVKLVEAENVPESRARS
jgi:basic membrane lipoprotein Med (substrate-binding protein (PBP1-ABC) superfamily)